MPATITIRSLVAVGAAEAFAIRACSQARSTMSSMSTRVAGLQRVDAPNQSEAPRRVAFGVSASIGETGRSRAMRSAVAPE